MSENRTFERLFKTFVRIRGGKAATDRRTLVRTDFVPVFGSWPKPGVFKIRRKNTPKKEFDNPIKGVSVLTYANRRKNDRKKEPKKMMRFTYAGHTFEAVIIDDGQFDLVADSSIPAVPSEFGVYPVEFATYEAFSEIENAVTDNKHEIAVLVHRAIRKLVGTGVFGMVN